MTGSGGEYRALMLKRVLIVSATAAASCIALATSGAAWTATAGAPAPAPRAVAAKTRPSMTFDQFIKTYDGQAVDIDDKNGSQCVDLTNLYNQKVVSGGKQWISGNGRDWWTSTDAQLTKNYTRISKDKVARNGDIAVWNSGPKGYGHVAIVISDGGSSLKTFTQSGYGKAHVGTLSNTYTYKSNTYTLRGYLRPKKISTTPTPPATAPVKAFMGNVSSSLKLGKAAADVTICADNLRGNTVRTVLSRPATHGYPKKSWSASKKATSRCVKFTNLDGSGDTFTSTVYTQRSALNQAPSSSWKGSGCFSQSGGQGLCDQKKR